MGSATEVPTLGARLRAVRKERGWSLRDVAQREGLAHGYLSQIENGKVTEPAPSVLRRVAAAYREPVTVVMQWAGYTAGEGLSPNQARVLAALGDPTDEELAVIRAVLTLLRSGKGRSVTDPD